MRTPKFFLQASFGIYRDGRYIELSKKEAIGRIANIGEAFLKPSIDSSSGEGCCLINMKDGINKLDGRSARDILLDAGDHFIIQERLKCHESITALYPNSVNTFRVITYRWKDGYYHMPVIMRIGRGGNYLDNAHAGGMFIAINDEGVLNRTAYTEFKEEYTVHPDTGITFEGYRVESFPKVLAAAKRMSQMIPQIGCINWDFTIDAEGEPVLIEANMDCGSVWLIEMAHGCGPFGDRTTEVLQWLRKMRRLPGSERHWYRFGKMQK